MSSIAITGGNDGIGRALAEVYLNRGYEVLIIGRNERKGRDFVDAARRRGAGDRAHFARADLSLVRENTDLLERIKDLLPTLDILVLCARYHRSTRTETPDGFESNFALFYLSRFLLSHGLAETLDQSERPLILNVAGPGGTGDIWWSDLQLRHGYLGTGALGHGGRLNDLLGAGFADQHTNSRIKYILFHPGVVSTSFSGEYDAATAAQVAGLKNFGKSIDQSIGQILPCLDSPPTERLSAFVEGRRIPVNNQLFDPRAGARLHQLTTRLLASPTTSPEVARHQDRSVDAG
ncbi:SDR family NAD(P)-dependent oxidoreductase [Frankia sp. AiPs1]|uniref:SDR family NAD(P)-dependent oxidoreductase n=1 Tax=Frankia sp. AiPs1 TaxID=573493 RepID=UPI0020433E38|nr:SDR family NAD(P)-dependent oxidoreductase [Frankia sp. AiPs1]MCM3920667.1 SDR family NAD(P)-dependent oxidoreductase [Frankia sp. AiPs1]